MFWLTKVCVLYIAIQLSYVCSTPILESINIDRKVNIAFKPMKFRPFSYIKERWGPFGRFGKKHTILRRDLDQMNTIDSRTGEIIKPVIERIEEPIKMGPVTLFRPPVQAVVDTKQTPAASKLNTDITQIIPPNPFFTPINKPEMEVLGAIPIKATAPIEGPLFVPVTPPPASVPPPPPAPVTPPLEEVPPRFGGIARFFGDIISEIFSRLLVRARMSFFPNPPPPAAQ